MNSADNETLRSLKAAMHLRLKDAAGEIDFAVEMGPGAAADRAMQRRAVALADAEAIRLLLEKAGSL